MISIYKGDLNEGALSQNSTSNEKSTYEFMQEQLLNVINKKLNEIVHINGNKPSRPETGYAYIAAEPTDVDEIYKVEAFKEKPNQETDEQYLSASNYYWKAGIFVWNINTISKAIHTSPPARR